MIRLGGQDDESKTALSSGDSVEWTFDVFAGANFRDVINNESDYPLYKKLNYIELIDTDSSCCSFIIIDSVVFGMMWLMSFLHAYPAFGNYGIAIILLVLIVRTILHPLSKKSQLSMREMGKLGPAVKKLQEKYADDKATLQKETMKLYRQGGISPIIGCLPMFLQMPILIALWNSIQLTAELRHAAFLPVWLTDLASPDALFAIPFTIPFLGSMIDNSFNLLPFLLCVAMFLQMKMNPQMSGGAVTPSPQQAQQQKMMKVLMPAMMLIFFYNAPSGLTLYFMASTFAGIIEAKVIRKHIEQKEALAAATEVVVQGPGKGARSSRPKKPKGPFWMKGK